MNKLLEWLMNYALDHHIGVITTRMLASDTPSQSDGNNRVVIINMSWQKHDELPFVFAHEIGHVLNGDTGIHKFCASTVKTKTEYQANATAIRVLLKYCQSNDIDVSNPVEFCERFGIPTEYEYIVSFLALPNTDDVKSCNY